MGIGAEQCRLAVKLGEEGYTRPIGWRGILLGHVIVENRKGLVVAACATPSSTTAEREAALQMLEAMGRSAEGVKGQTPLITLGADTLYQEQKSIAELRRKVVPQEIQNTRRAGCDVRLEQT